MPWQPHIKKQSNLGHGYLGSAFIPYFDPQSSCPVLELESNAVFSYRLTPSKDITSDVSDTQDVDFWVMR